ncbi:AAA family ATPase [Sphingomonas sp. CFBP 8764]|uniref:AAA family ATPase n=1 Tax=Sphingomonas sp. CFBP 8764 TaxID=2775275 RepID=UPI00177B8A4F|nr:AAA family ATPase [Sphingomonas sp. CFBP 8764]MBD8549868.1 AAA family ATPase [Sphingomonas sp. CFBP 8764]
MTIADLASTLVHNPIFAGVAGGAGMSAALYQAQRIPAAIVGIVKRTFTVSRLINNDEELFERLCMYLSDAPFVRRARWLRMVQKYDDHKQAWGSHATFGIGWHLLRHEGHLILLHRPGERDSKALVPQRMETITLRSFGKGQDALRYLMARAENVYESISTIRVYLWHKGSYLMADRKPARNPETLFLAPKQRERIISDLQAFTERRDEYRRRGTPYRRGYLFEGLPGTGKTTLSSVFAIVLNRPIYIINPNTAGGDTGLQAAFSAVDPGGIVVMEDIDAMRAARRRDDLSSAEPAVRPEEVVTLGGLLNAIDGLGSRDNRVLVMTSNHAEMLDPALLRPGRIDVREVIDLMDESTARRMADYWGAYAVPQSERFGKWC